MMPGTLVRVAARIPEVTVDDVAGIRVGNRTESRAGAAAAVAACLLAVPLATACGGGDASAEGPVVRDSAGVRIVENGPAPDSAGSTWRLAPEPELEIGAVQGPDEQQLDHVVDAVRTSDGTVAVAQGGTGEIAFFDSAGRHLRSAGGQGGGPGEFRGLADLVRMPGDTLLAWDRRQERVSMFTAEGAFGRSRELRPPGESVGLRFAGVLDDDTLILAAVGAMGGDVTTGRYRRTLTLHRYAAGRSSEGRIARVFATPRFGWSYRHRGRETLLITRVPFAGRTFFAVTSSRVCASTGGTFEFRCRSADGRLRTVVRDSVVRPPVTGEVRDRFVESRLQELEGSEHQSRMQSLFEELDDVPDRMPAVSRIMGDAEDNVWVRTYRPPYESGPKRWRVFGPDGVRRATVEMPAEFTPYQIGPDRLVGKWEGDLGVDFVRVYRLRK